MHVFDLRLAMRPFFQHPTQPNGGQMFMPRDVVGNQLVLPSPVVDPHSLQINTVFTYSIAGSQSWQQHISWVQPAGRRHS